MQVAAVAAPPAGQWVTQSQFVPVPAVASQPRQEALSAPSAPHNHVVHTFVQPAPGSAPLAEGVTGRLHHPPGMQFGRVGNPCTASLGALAAAYSTGTAAGSPLSTAAAAAAAAAAVASASACASSCSGTGARSALEGLVGAPLASSFGLLMFSLPPQY